jgi:dipeptidyl aminopeptidase/acylaminoacyl peptidase
MHASGLFFQIKVCACLGLIAIATELVYAQEQRQARPQTREVVEPLNLSYNNEISGVNVVLQETYIYSSDGLYIPAVVLKPVGEGPFPAVVMVHGSPGGRGMSELKQEIQFHGMVPERFLKERYVGVFCDYRARQAEGMIGDPAVYSNAADVVSVIRYTKSLPYVKRDAVCLYGGSLGALISILAIGVEPVAAAVFNAPPTFPILGLTRETSGSGRQPFPSEITDAMINKVQADQILGKIQNPVLFVVGTADGLMGQVRKAHTLMQSLGKDVSIDLYPDEQHGFYWGPRKQDGEYAPSPAFTQALDKAAEFFGANTK